MINVSYIAFVQIASVVIIVLKIKSIVSEHCRSGQVVYEVMQSEGIVN